MMKISKNGFTLMELILYVTLSSVVLTSVAVMVPYVLETRLKNQVVLEVEEQGRYVMSNIAREVRNAESIVLPSIGNSGVVLEINVIDASSSPTVYTLSNNQLELTQGSSASVNLTNDKVRLSNLNFRNLSKQNTGGAIRIEFTLEYNNVSDREIFDYSREFFGTAVIKKS